MLSRHVFSRLIDSILHDATTSVLSGGGKAARPLSNNGHMKWRRDASSSSKQWQSRQQKDRFAKEAKVQGLKSRAAFKLLEINAKYKIFKKGQTVVDLVRAPDDMTSCLANIFIKGYAPGSWSQVAVDRTSPDGRVIGIDIIPAQPPKGVSTIQGNFLSPEVQAEVKRFVRDPNRGRLRRQGIFSSSEPGGGEVTEQEFEESEKGYVDFEKGALLESTDTPQKVDDLARLSRKGKEEAEGRVVDVVLSDMSAPWDQTTGFWKKSLSDPYFRMMNTSGISFRDHAGSMDLCLAALKFSFETLRANGHFVCKFYQGAEDKLLELRLKRLFKSVHREKPESSRSESKEAFFVALRRKEDVDEKTVFFDQ